MSNLRPPTYESPARPAMESTIGILSFLADRQRADLDREMVMNDRALQTKNELYKLRMTENEMALGHIEADRRARNDQFGQFLQLMDYQAKSKIQELQVQDLIRSNKIRDDQLEAETQIGDQVESVISGRGSLPDLVLRATVVAQSPWFRKLDLNRQERIRTIANNTGNLHKFDGQADQEWGVLVANASDSDPAIVGRAGFALRRMGVSEDVLKEMFPRMRDPNADMAKRELDRQFSGLTDAEAIALQDAQATEAQYRATFEDAKARNGGTNPNKWAPEDKEWADSVAGQSYQSAVNLITKLQGKVQSGARSSGIKDAGGKFTAPIGALTDGYFENFNAADAAGLVTPEERAAFREHTVSLSAEFANVAAASINPGSLAHIAATMRFAEAVRRFETSVIGPKLGQVNVGMLVGPTNLTIAQTSQAARMANTAALINGAAMTPRTYSLASPDGGVVTVADLERISDPAVRYKILETSKTAGLIDSYSYKDGKLVVNTEFSRLENSRKSDSKGIPSRISGVQPFGNLNLVDAEELADGIDQGDLVTAYDPESAYATSGTGFKPDEPAWRYLSRMGGPGLTEFSLGSPDRAAEKASWWKGGLDKDSDKQLGTLLAGPGYLASDVAYQAVITSVIKQGAQDPASAPAAYALVKKLNDRYIERRGKLGYAPIPVASFIRDPQIDAQFRANLKQQSRMDPGSLGALFDAPSAIAPAPRSDNVPPAQAAAASPMPN